MVLVDPELSIARQSHFEPLQRARGRPVLHCAIGVEYAAMAGTMEALVALEITHRAAEMGTHGVGHGETLVTVAEHENLLVRQERRGAEREVRRVANLE